MAYTQIQVGAIPNYQPGEQNQTGGPQGEGYVSELLPKYTSLARQGKIIKYVAPAVTLAYLHLGTATAQAFALENPVNSGVNAFFLWTSVGFLTGTTVIGALVWAMQNMSVYPPTSPTAATAVNANPMFSVGQVVPYSALTYAASSSPTVMDLVLPTPTTSTAYNSLITKDHGGGLVLPPGYVAFLGQLTAAAAAGSAEVAWIELPVPPSAY